MRIIARSTSLRFAECGVPPAEPSILKKHLDAWYAVVSKAAWRNSAELKGTFASASVVTAQRVVFNIKGKDRCACIIDGGHQTVR